MYSRVDPRTGVMLTASPTDIASASKPSASEESKSGSKAKKQAPAAVAMETDADSAAEMQPDDAINAGQDAKSDSKSAEPSSAAVPLFAHISRISDKHIAHLGQKFTAGQTKPVRVLSLNSLDGVANVTMNPKIIAQPIMWYDDLKPGQVVKVRHLEAMRP